MSVRRKARSDHCISTIILGAQLTHIQFCRAALQETIGIYVDLQPEIAGPFQAAQPLADEGLGRHVAAAFDEEAAAMDGRAAWRVVRVRDPAPRRLPSGVHAPPSPAPGAPRRRHRLPDIMSAASRPKGGMPACLRSSSSIFRKRGWSWSFSASMTDAPDHRSGSAPAPAAPRVRHAPPPGAAADRSAPPRAGPRRRVRDRHRPRRPK